MPITKIEFKPGIHRESTQYAEGGNWYDCDKVRFRAGRPEKIGGWEKANPQALKGACRVMMDWSLLDGTSCLALGTNKKFYIEESGAIFDITPIRFSDTDADTITSGTAGTNIHTYTTSVAHGAEVGDFVTISGAANVDGICSDAYTNPFTTLAAGSGLVRVTTPAPHYAVVGDTVTFSGATGFDGIPSGDFNTSLTVLEVMSPTSYTVNVATPATAGFVSGGGAVTGVYLARLNREFEILTTPTTTTFTFQTVTNCVSGGVTGGGATVTAAFQISIGFSFNITGGGWGTGKWSRGTWSSALTSSVSGITMRIWSVDNYGEDLIFCTRDGPLYYWDASSGLSARGVLVSSLGGASSVPTQTSIVRVTDDRHVLAIGTTSAITTAFDPLLIRWSDQEDFTNWTPAITNTAGSQRIPMGSYVVAAITARQETLIWTDHSLHSLQFTGPPFTFSLQTLAENTDIAGPNAAINTNNVTYWMGHNRFWVYSGRVQAIPCSVQRYVFDNLNFQQLSQIYASTNNSFTEVTWFYCSAASSIVDRYVTYNYEEGAWYYGALSRSAMIQCSGRQGAIYATDGGYSADDGALFVHEVGYDDGSTNPPSPISAYIESADFSIADGSNLMFVDRVIPDLTFTRSTSTAPAVDITVEAKKFPGQAVQSEDIRQVTKNITATVNQFTNQVWARLRGREMRLRISSTGLGVSWILGATRINVRPDGKQ